ncbi:hypothetical protein Ssi03_35700 [Sphaerisporangium siamense]|uniref:Fe2OG dioxygenase domain-containing protein n=1 Tax=Sphaerisporangium siamense TaxID=795645 RepID=A0A7W7D758_9ACTN|nr:hypothetical protein [Sphaerisporangium siamense]MBB4701457.1 hypothetical protein [Sphaerisporangium siamense]GII85580.1 hypothetical protein Ssi03_35700 [Sphaerisporangium siamense]
MSDVGALLLDLETHLATNVSEESIARARRDFSYLGHAKIPFLVPDSVKKAVADEVNRLLEVGSVRRDVSFAETDHSPRRMRNVRRKEIVEFGTVIPGVYNSARMLQSLGQIAGEPVHPCPYEPEQFVITCLEKDGDTHGWHWDDYSFAVVWVIETPPIADGGFVQCVPGTVWNKADPQINRTLTRHPIYSVELFSGDLYLMRTDTTLHRVYPVVNGTRKIINMGYASTRNLTMELSHETMDGLWADPETLEVSR